MSKVLHLFQLQKIDTELDQISHRMNEIAAIIESDVSLQIANKKVSEARSTLQRSRLAMRNAEELVTDQQLKIEIGESNLYSGKISNPKELQDLQNEIISLKKYLVNLENIQLDMMLNLEVAENELKNAELEFVQVQADLAISHASLLGEKSTLERNKGRLLIERQVCQSQISADDLVMYDKLREQKRGLAVSSIEEGACLACGSSFRPAELQSAKSPNRLFYCSSCGRIVYAG